jgi:hypothetical protein
MAYGSAKARQVDGARLCNVRTRLFYNMLRGTAAPNQPYG